ncbi:MAG TPA: hypothetical protein VGX91_11160 [Candidatus Cybelea sp.]|jgi:hypothetical protein|nr:hypothetical protein [Candidatus Cybelea sp.]
MAFWFSGIPILVALPLFAALFAVLAVAAHMVVRHFFAPDRLAPQHEVAGFIVSVVGVLYSVVLGFLVGTVWQNFSTAQDTTNKEAAYVGDAFNFAGLLVEPERKRLQKMIARYAFDVRNVEMVSMEKNSADGDALEQLNDAVKLTVSMPQPLPGKGVSAELESNGIRTELLDSLRNLGDSRRVRLVESQDRLPAGMLEALILGAVMVVAFVFFFGMKSALKQMALTALLAASIGLFFGLVVELSTPYSGAIRVSPSAWDDVIANNHLANFTAPR